MRRPPPARAPRPLGLLAVGVLLSGLGLGLGCGRGPSVETAEFGDGPRIVSLIPSATLALIEAGRGEAIVGVGEHDPAAEAGLPRDTPRAGSFLDVDDERLAALRPTLVVVPEGVRLRLPVGAEALVPSHPSTVEEAAANMERLGAWGAAAAVRAAFAEAPPASAAAKAPRVLLAFGVAPVWASGPGTVNDEVLRAAGGVNALGHAAAPAITLDEEALLALAPDLVLLLLPGREAVEAEADRVGLEATLRAGGVGARVETITDRFVLLPGPNLVQTLERFRGAVAGG